MIEIVSGSLLDSKEKYILHQTNCISQNSAGIAKAIFDKYPYADVYKDRMKPDDVGSIKISGNGIDQRFIINMFAQYYPGGPKYPDSGKDGLLAREKYFHKCLLKVARIPNLESVALPWNIGCGLGGGIWAHYISTITNFANYIEDKQNAKVFIYRLEGVE